MTATHIQTPIGPFPIDEGTRRQLASMTDHELAEKTLGRLIWPEGLAEMQARRLVFPGDHKVDIMKRIDSQQ